MDWLRAECGAGDQHVDAPQPIVDGAKDPVDAFARRRILDDADHLAIDPGERGVERVAMPPEGQDAGALVRQCLQRGAADAGGTPGQQDAAAGQHGGVFGHRYSQVRIRRPCAGTR